MKGVKEFTDEEGRLIREVTLSDESIAKVKVPTLRELQVLGRKYKIQRGTSHFYAASEFITFKDGKRSPQQIKEMLIGDVIRITLALK